MTDKPSAKPTAGSAAKPTGKSSDKAPAKAADAPASPDDKPRSRLSWLVGWVLVPSTVLALIFGGGVVVGAHFTESWFPRAVVWLVQLFV